MWFLIEFGVTANHLDYAEMKLVGCDIKVGPLACHQRQLGLPLSLTALPLQFLLVCMSCENSNTITLHQKPHPALVTQYHHKHDRSHSIANMTAPYGFWPKISKQTHPPSPKVIIEFGPARPPGQIYKSSTFALASSGFSLSSFTEVTIKCCPIC